MPRLVPIAAGVLGWVSAGIAFLASVVPAIVAETKHEVKVEAFGKLLSSKLRKYEIDGVSDGTFSDIPEGDWPKDHDSGLS